MSLKELFSDWIEPDVASFYLACELGLMEYNDNLTLGGYFEVSHVFEVRTQFGTMCYEMLENMAVCGILEKKDDYEYRWNTSFKGYWEGGKQGR
jgi:hypothetical protein